MVRETLDFITVEQKLLRPLEEEYTYSEIEKHILGWAIALEGMITIGETSNGTFRPTIVISNTEFSLLEQLKQIGRFGGIYKSTKAEGNRKEGRRWGTAQIRAVLFILQQIHDYIPSPRKKRVSELTIEFCQSRINAHATQANPAYSQRERDIVKEVRKLNRRGRKKE